MGLRSIQAAIVGLCVVVTPIRNASPQQFASPLQNRTDSDVPVKQTHVVIVGAGISGLTAALELGRNGARVTVIDMSSVFGGHAVMSQGGVCIVASPLQATLGIEDSPDLAYRDFISWGEDADPDWVRYYVENSRREIYDWLTEIGIRFESVKTAPGNTVNRFHQPIGRGIGLVTPIYRECLKLDNIEFVWNSKAEKLLIDKGRTVGVLARNLRTHEERAFPANAVILATGGFQSNLEMVRRYWPQEFRFPAQVLVGSGVNSMGYGHQLAQLVGAQLVRMDHQWNYFTGIPDPRISNSNRGLSAANMYGIIVNSEGRRFANLHGWAKVVMPKLFSQERATLWFIFDEASKPKFVVSGTDWANFKTVEKWILNNPLLVKSAGSIERLADRAGLPPQKLVETVHRYNTLVERGEDEDFGRFGKGKPAFSNSASPKIDTPPFYAMQSFPLTRKSMGGVAIDQSCQVLDRKHRPIPGLYAVGELTGLAGINGKAALEGTFLGPCIITGRVAGRSALKQAAATRVASIGPGFERNKKKSPRGSLAKKRKSADNIPPGDQPRKTCLACHDMKILLANTRPGYRHFERVHTATVERHMDCHDCHSELAPYRRDRHRIDHRALASKCVVCHIAQE